MNEEIDENEFYHRDFTTASDFELFLYRMEQVVRQWVAEDSKEVESSPSDLWIIKKDTLSFADADFEIKYHKKRTDIPPDDIFSTSHSVETNASNNNPLNTFQDFQTYNSNLDMSNVCLSIWYCLSRYITLSPVSNIPIKSESKMKLLLSCASMVANNTKCEIPIFVQIRDKWQNYYMGVFEDASTRTDFEMVHLKRGPRHCQFLSGLLDVFKTKLLSPRSLDPVIVSMQFYFLLQDFGNYAWKQDPLNSDNDNFDGTGLTILPFGVTVDPISSITLRTTWLHLIEHVIVDNENYSDLDPMHAPIWSFYVTKADKPVCLLTECLDEFSYLLNNTHTIYELLGDFVSAPAPDVNNPLDLLTEPKVPSITSLISRAAERASRNSLTKTRKGTAPLADDVLVPILYFLFPDADDSTAYPYNLTAIDKHMENKENVELTEAVNLDFECRGFKTCSIDSLVWRLSIVLGHCLQSLGGTRALAHLWYEFVHEMRYRWEKSIPIKGLQSGFPDLRTCLLNQKLQMLNCCIERKIARETGATSVQFESAEDSSTDDEEFFDCSPDKPEDDPKRKGLWHTPVGRLGKFGGLKLLETGDPLYIPITQDPVPKTEDQLEEDTDVLMQLGSDAEASELRAKLMSASLLSDMESFKAANPGAILEDFIRWYSPRDWVEEDALDEWGQKKGNLSPRMMLEHNNIWVEMWQSAKPVPANRQKRLFDDTREAEKVLHFLDSRNLAQIAELILPILAHAAIYRIGEEAQQVATMLKDCSTLVRQLIKHTERITRDTKLHPRRFETFLQEMAQLEMSISQINSLTYKFCPTGNVGEELSQTVARLVSGFEAKIDDKNSEMGKSLITMFSEAQKTFHMTTRETEEGGSQTNEGNKYSSSSSSLPPPYQREYVMRVKAARPNYYSEKVHHFMRAILSRNEFRLTGAFSLDIVF